MSSEYEDYGNMEYGTRLPHRFRLSNFESRNKIPVSSQSFSNMSQQEGLKNLEYYKNFLSSFKKRKNTPSLVRKKGIASTSSLNSSSYDKICPSYSSNRSEKGRKSHLRNPCGLEINKERRTRDQNSSNIVIINYKNYESACLKKLKKDKAREKHSTREEYKIRGDKLSSRRETQREDSQKLLPSGSQGVRSEQQFFTTGDVCQLQTEDSYCAPLKTQSDARNNTEDESPDKDQASRIRPWKASEDQNLLTLYEKYPDNWKKIAKSFPERDEKQCRTRITRIKVHNKVKQGWWSQEEVEQLTKYYRTFGNSWAQIAKRMKTRTAAQIKDKMRELNKSESKPKTKKVMFDYQPTEIDETGCKEADEVFDNNFSSKAHQFNPIKREKTKEVSKRLDIKREPSFFNFSDLNEISEMFEESKRIDENIDTRRMMTDSDYNLKMSSNEFLSVKTPEIMKMNSREQFDDILNKSLSSAQ
ncbi:unnamed protein product [Moneuplotes crassus]|uniref:Myb-like DNA-binding domain containing protein n=1 Tax=Euplotes crassus TaxID=5936 RepID=A0AAD1X8Q9_EUPCR|nr:unnamed protein product [Moneuplotes crassus]